MEVYISFKKRFVGVFYRPPPTCPSFFDGHHDAVNKIIVRFPNVPIIRIDDFNYPSIVRSMVPPQPSPCSNECVNFLSPCDDFNFSQLVTQPTRVTMAATSVSDLVLTSVSEIISPLPYLVVATI